MQLIIKQRCFKMTYFRHAFPTDSNTHYGFFISVDFNFNTTTCKLTSSHFNHMFLSVDGIISLNLEWLVTFTLSSNGILKIFSRITKNGSFINNPNTVKIWIFFILSFEILQKYLNQNNLKFCLNKWIWKLCVPLQMKITKMPLIFIFLRIIFQWLLIFDF